MTRNLPLGTLLGCLLGLAAACTAADTGDTDIGKGDSPEERCESAQVDDSGVCRASDGTFAKADCCLANQMCAASTFDGDSCRAPNGQFAPLACCEAACDGASLDSGGFCRNADGTFAFEACCADECIGGQAPPVAIEVETIPGSCEVSDCGQEDVDPNDVEPSADGCFCDISCIEFGDCCEDAVDVCDLDPGNAPVGESCQDSCGGEDPTGSCFCDDQCEELGDCCTDKAEFCGGEGSPLPDCSEVECDGAELDDAGVCRKANGQFAKSTCCTQPLDCENATVDNNGFCRDSETGQFAALACCEGICDASSIDRNGFCRNGDGTFAKTGCCADLCFVRQGQSDRSDRAEDTAACNGEQRDD